MTVVRFPGGSRGADVSAGDAEERGGRRQRDGRGDFFAVDRRAWDVVCGSVGREGLGVNPAVAYLVLARGTGRDNRETPWSVNALEQRSLMSRGRAQAAIEELKARGVIRQTGFGGKATRYMLVSAHEIRGSEAYRPQLDKAEAFLWNRLLQAHRTVVPRTGTVATWGTTHPLQVARELVNKGYAIEDRGAFQATSGSEEEASQPDWIWLPNTLIDGAAGDIASPLELVRRTQDVLALRLLVDLYHGQDLAEFGGISWRTIRQGYVAERLDQKGPFAVWAFHSETATAWPIGSLQPHFRGKADSPERKESNTAFWKRWDTLRRLGLVEEVPHLIEADTEDAGVIHACPQAGQGEEVEQHLGQAARAAALALLPPDKADLYRRYPNTILTPIRLEYAQALLVGLYRLRYRPRNARTGAWWARLQEEGPKVAAGLRAIAERSGAAGENEQFL